MSQPSASGAFAPLELLSTIAIAILQYARWSQFLPLLLGWVFALLGAALLVLVAFEEAAVTVLATLHGWLAGLPGTDWLAAQLGEAVEAGDDGAVHLSDETVMPVVAARTGGIPDLIQDRVDGFLVTPGDINEYVDRLRKLQDDVSLRRAMGVAARQEMQQYSWKTASEDLRVVQYTAAIESFHQRWEQRLWRLFYGQKDDVKWTGVSV